MGHDSGNHISRDESASGSYSLHLIWLKIWTRVSISLGEAKRPKARIALRKCIAWNHQRVCLCRICQYDWGGQGMRYLVQLLGMNSQQLISILKQDDYKGPLFRGVYQINCLPPIGEGSSVINTAPDTYPGLHWIALFMKHDTIEYFDAVTIGQEKTMGE